MLLSGDIEVNYREDVEMILCVVVMMVYLMLFTVCA